MTVDPLAPFQLARLDDRTTWRALTVGYLEVSAGHVAAGDPIAGGVGAFTRVVPAGRYRVEVAIARFEGEERVGAARLCLREERPAHWEMAVRPGQRTETLRSGQAFGYGVDSGAGCFADAARLAVLDADAVARKLAANRRDAVAHAAWPAPQSATVVAFSSGFGDGIYPSYWGLAADGEPVCLVTDFGVAEITWPDAADHPAERAEYARALMARLREATGAEGDEIARALGTLGAEARDLAGELLGMLRAPAREEAWGGIQQALAEIAREAPEVADLAAELWTPDDPRGAAYLAVVRRARQLTPATRAVLVRAAADRRRDPAERVANLERVAPELDLDAAHALLDPLADDPEPDVRIAAFAQLRDLDPLLIWQHRVERLVGDASADVRRRLAMELGAVSAQIERWAPVLAPMLADIDPGVQLEAARVLARSRHHWPLTMDVFAQVLAAPDVRDAQGEAMHSRALWALRQGRVPRSRARALLEPLRDALAAHPALDELLPPRGRRERVRTAGTKKGERAEATAKPKVKRGAKGATKSRAATTVKTGRSKRVRARSTSVAGATSTKSKRGR